MEERSREHLAITFVTRYMAPRMHVENHRSFGIALDIAHRIRFLSLPPLLSLYCFLYLFFSFFWFFLIFDYHGGNGIALTNDQGTELELVLPECDQSSELTCRNGACVPLDSRCDGTEQCEDGSDELDCHSTLGPTTTRKYHPIYIRTYRPT